MCVQVWLHSFHFGSLTLLKFIFIWSFVILTTIIFYFIITHSTVTESVFPVEMPEIWEKSQNIAKKKKKKSFTLAWGEKDFLLHLSCSFMPPCLGGILDPTCCCFMGDRCNRRVDSLIRVWSEWIWVCYRLDAQQEFRVTQVWQTKCVRNWCMLFCPFDPQIPSYYLIKRWCFQGWMVGGWG